MYNVRKSKLQQLKCWDINCVINLHIVSFICKLICVSDCGILNWWKLVNGKELQYICVCKFHLYFYHLSKIVCIKLCIYIYIYIFVVFYMPKYIFVYKRRITVLVTSIPQGVSSIAHQSMTACLHRKLPSAATFH